MTESLFPSSNWGCLISARNVFRVNIKQRAPISGCVAIDVLRYRHVCWQPDISYPNTLDGRILLKCLPCQRSVKERPGEYDVCMCMYVAFIVFVHNLSSFYLCMRFSLIGLIIIKKNDWLH